MDRLYGKSRYKSQYGWQRQDNIYIERFFRTIKYDYIYLNPIESGLELYEGIRDFIAEYNNRKHQGINYQKPKDLIKFEPNYQLKSA